MNDEYEVRKGERKTGDGISTRLNIPIRRINHNSTYAFTSHTLHRDLGFNTGIFGTETSD
jgi:hypothetical protein